MDREKAYRTLLICKHGIPHRKLSIKMLSHLLELWKQEEEEEKKSICLCQQRR